MLGRTARPFAYESPSDEFTFACHARNVMPEKVSPLAGKTIEPSMLVNVPRLVTAYFTGKPDPMVPSQRVAFGTSGHRGSAFDNAFN